LRDAAQVNYHTTFPISFIDSPGGYIMRERITHSSKFINGQEISMKELFCGKVYANGEWLENCIIRMQSGVISELLPNSQKSANALDYSGMICSPGFINIHIHGSKGRDTMDGTIESLQIIADFQASHGTTSFIPTTMTAAVEKVHKSLQAIDQFMKIQKNGSLCLGTHLEGPFINPAAKGAQNGQYIQAPSVDAYKDLCGPYLSVVRTITLAVEQPGAEELIRYLSAQNIVPIIGHTKATYQQARDSFGWGIRHTTHLFNAMTGLNHREPGVVGAALEDDAVTVELIADLIHLHPAAIRIVIAAKGPQQIALVTDSMSAAGLSSGEYELGGQAVFVKNNEARLADGTLAGSIISQDMAVRNLVSVGIPLETILEMSSATPARILGIYGRKGVIHRSGDADLTILSPELEVKAVFIGGELVK
jgi:N-acetylglucosamine-6-phosphate deacetylase